MQEIHLGIGAVKEAIEEGEFLGEVPASAFITGNALASDIGLTEGTAQNSNEPWLKFLDSVDGKTKYIAKKTFRYYISWNQIHARGAVYGDATVVIQGDTYKVRLLKGAASDPTTTGNGYNLEKTWDSEWNRLLYPLVPNTANSNNIPTYPISGEGLTFGAWADYTDAELDITGRYTWCQETTGTARVLRGYTGLSRFALISSSYTGPSYGWRPVLELVP